MRILLLSLLLGLAAGPRAATAAQAAADSAASGSAAADSVTAGSAAPGSADAAPEVLTDDAALGMAGPRLTPRPLLTMAEVVGINALIWSYNRYLRQNGENPGFRIGFNSWQENLNNGFEWDDNNFKTNMFAHPYHGSMYFNAARSNNYDFWTSIPFAFAGSFLWEYFFEVHHPSYNDWVATSVGGATLGEMMHRVSDLILDDTSTGGGRAWREVGALVVNPMRGFNRIVTGETSRQGNNENRLRPGYLGLSFDAGIRHTGEDKLSETDTTRVFLDIQGRYGDPFAGDNKRPFDTFDLEVRLNFEDASVLAGLATHGLLYATDLGKSESSSHLLGVNLNFDYMNTNAFTLGGQSVTAGVVSRFHETPVGEIETRVHLGAVPLGGVKSDYESYTGRAYDFGPGALANLAAALRRHGRPWLSLRHTQAWIHTLNGTDGWHWVSLTRLRLDIPIVERVGVGAEYQLYLSHNDYEDLDDTRLRYPELRAFASFPLH